MAKENRQYKDSVFCDLYYSDESAGENLLELYNALFEEHLDDTSRIEKVRLEDVLFKNMKNDVAFTVNGQKIILSEHQSTVNPNMPVRMLMYIAREYEKLMPTETRYSEKLYMIPAPYFFAFYNGTEDQPMEQWLHLADAFPHNENGECQLELTVRVININTAKGHPLLKDCRTLRQYSELIERTRGLGGDRKALESAVKSCIRDGILQDYLRRKSGEVMNMLMIEYDYQKDLEVHCREAEEKGLEKGIEIGDREGRIAVYYEELHYPVGKIARRLSLTEEQVEQVLIRKGLLPERL